MGNLRQSIASLTEGIRLAPQNADAYFNRGASYFQLGELENAIQDFSMVIRLAPRDEAAYYWRGIAQESAGRQREAIADYGQFLALSQDENTRAEVEARLSQWNATNQTSVRHQGLALSQAQTTGQVGPGKPDQEPDLYRLIVALGDRALH